MDHNPLPERVYLSAVIEMLSLFLLLSLTACTRSTIPIDATATIEQISTQAPQLEPTQATTGFIPSSGTYAVVWTPEDEMLPLRVPAGIAGSIVDELTFDARGIQVTGNSTSLGSSLWVEIRGPDGEMGWVNSWNLTEEVPGEVFCANPEILGLLEQITMAFLTDDIDALIGLINPSRGLILRHDWWNPEVIIRPTDLPRLFVARDQLAWGALSGGDFLIEGSFEQVFSPILKDVLSQTPTAVCGDIPEGVTSVPVVWPGEYANLHYYAFYRPSPEDGNRFDWRTLVFGFEYLQGKPYLTLLVHYHGDI